VGVEVAAGIAVPVAVDVRTAVAVRVAVLVAVLIAALVAVLVGVGPLPLDRVKASMIDPDGTKMCPAPDDGAAKCTGVPAIGSANSCWLVLGLKPSSSLCPASIFQSTPPAMIGGLEPWPPL
jgi:hypothetical protein